MSDSFWSACTDAMIAHRGSNRSEALRLLGIATACLAEQPSELVSLEKRQSYLDRLKAHLGVAESRASTTGSESTSVPDERLFYPQPISVELRKRFGISQNVLAIAISGDGRPIHYAAHAVVSQAVEWLNRNGCPSMLMDPGQCVDPSQPKGGGRVHQDREMRTLRRQDLPDMLAAADVVVYVGAMNEPITAAGRFRLLEHFAMGRAVILPGRVENMDIVSKRDAYVLEKFDTSGVVRAICEIRNEKGLADILAKGAVDFYLNSSAAPRRGSAGFQTSLAAKSEKILMPSFQPAGANKQVESRASLEVTKASAVPAGEEVRRLKSKILDLEKQNQELADRVRSMPSIDPLCISDPAFIWSDQPQEDFGIIVFGHTRLNELAAVLESLKRQGALRHTEVWLDGFQGNGNLKKKIEEAAALVKTYPVKHLHTQAGNFGFRKMLLLGLAEMCRKYRDIMILEDDCFPTRDAVFEFRKEIDLIRNNRGIFSVYGHHFLVESEKDVCARFQGWGWGTTSEKLLPILRQLIDCYSMTEVRYLKFIRHTFTADVKKRIDVTHPRQPSYTLEKFFAWDETLCLLTALSNQVHKPTKTRTIYNCGMGAGSTHFDDIALFRNPPFNLITPTEVWQYF